MHIRVAEHFAPLFNPANENYHKRYIVYYGGRGSGKTVSIAKALLFRGHQNKERILCAREFQNSIADSVIRTLADEIGELGLDDFYEVQRDRIIGKNGTEFIFKGLRHNVQSIKSLAGITICWCEEAQTLSDESLNILIPTIREEGSQIIMSLNPDEEDDPVYQRFIINPPPDAFVLKVNFDANPWFPQTLAKEAEYARRDAEIYNHVWLGQPRRAGLGAVYGKEMAAALEQGRITSVAYTSASPVYTFWDLGYNDSTAIWWAQLIGREPRVIDYYENSMMALDHYAQVVRDKPYSYCGHILPHDAGHNSLRTGTTLVSQVQGMGLNNVEVLPIASIAPGIESTRQFISQAFFDATRCKTGLHCLRKYHYKWDENLKRFSNVPVHDWSSNGADAARYMATWFAMGANRGTVSVVDPDTYSRGMGFY